MSSSRSPISLPAFRFSHPRAWRLAWWLWFGVLFVLSSIPGYRFGPMPFNWFDKVQHTGFFGLGGLFLGGWLVASGRWPSRWWWLPVAAAVVGAFDEIHQLFTPGRSGLDIGDWLADILGGSLAAAAVHILYKNQRECPPSA